MMNNKHNCIAFNLVGARQPASNMAYLLEKIPSLLTVTTKTTSLAIKDAIQLYLGQLVPKDQYGRAKKLILKDIIAK